MASLKQINANRKNAKKSTGPKDTTRTRFNACVHRFRGTTVLLPNESQEEYGNKADTYFNDFQPVGTYEHELVLRLVNRVWELNRITALKSQVAVEACYRNTLEDELIKLERYETSIERSILRIRKEITQTQAARHKQVKEGTRAIDETHPKHSGPTLSEASPDPKKPYIGPHFDGYLLTEGEKAFKGLYKAAFNLVQYKSPFPYEKPNALTALKAEVSMKKFLSERIAEYIASFGLHPNTSPPIPKG